MGAAFLVPDDPLRISPDSLHFGPLSPAFKEGRKTDFQDFAAQLSGYQQADSARLPACLPEAIRGTAPSDISCNCPTSHRGEILDSNTLQYYLDEGADFSNLRIEGVQFSNALPNADFRCSTIGGPKVGQAVTFLNTDLSGADFSCGSLTGTKFANATLNGAKFNRSSLHGVTFDNAKVMSASFICSSLFDPKFIGMKGAVSLPAFDFRGALLNTVDLSGFSAGYLRLNYAMIGAGFVPPSDLTLLSPPDDSEFGRTLFVASITFEGLAPTSSGNPSTIPTGEFSIRSDIKFDRAIAALADLEKHIGREGTLPDTQQGIAERIERYRNWWYDSEGSVRSLILRGLQRIRWSLTGVTPSVGHVVEVYLGVAGLFVALATLLSFLPRRESNAPVWAQFRVPGEGNMEKFLALNLRRLLHGEDPLEDVVEKEQLARLPPNGPEVVWFFARVVLQAALTPPRLVVGIFGTVVGGINLGFKAWSPDNSCTQIVYFLIGACFWLVLLAAADGFLGVEALLTP